MNRAAEAGFSRCSASMNAFSRAALSPSSGCAAETNAEARIASNIAQRMDRLITLRRHLAPQARDRQRAIGIGSAARRS